MSIPEPTERRADWGLMLIFAILSLGIVVGGTFYYRHYERQFRAAAEHQLAAIAELKVGELAQYRKERMEDAAVFFENTAFSGLVRRFLDHPEDADAQQQIQEWIVKCTATDQYDLGCLFDPQGVIRMSIPAGRPPIASDVSQRIPEVLRLNRVSFQDFHRNEHDHRVYLTLLVPILNGPDHSQALGVLALRINPETYLYPFIRRWPAPSLTAETLLVRREGNTALFLNELKFQTNTALNLRIPLEKTNVAAVEAVLGQEGIVESRDYRGVPVLAALRAIPDSPWSLVARRDAAEVFAPMRDRLWQVVVMICVLLFGSGACVGLVWRQQRSRFYQAQYESAEALRRSETKFRTVADWTYDMETWRGPDGRFLYVSPSAERITGYRAEEFLADPELTLKITHPDDLARVTEHHQKVSRPGNDVCGMDFRILTRRGEERWINHHCQPVYDADGRWLGQRSGNRDITERKQMEEKLRELSWAVEQSPASIVITDRAGDMEYVNPKFVNVTGYTLAEALGKNPRILKSGEKGPEAYRELWQTITTGKEWRGEFHNKKKNGELYWESASISPIRDLAGRITHYVAVKEDITARKQTEAERDRLIHDLQDALANVKSLSGLLPICAGCKKIRDDKGYWSQVESYIQKHSEARFSHGMCPDCLKKWYPDLVESGLGNQPQEAP
jgi:PAS domain S-box-containing protein